MSTKPEALEWIRRVAESLGDMIDEVVFLGGATAGLLITAPSISSIRPTKDVDVIVEVGTWGEYAHFLERLRERGFSEDTEEGAPICRWVIDDIKVDVMPTKEEVLGLSNRWYVGAASTANTFRLSDTITIRLVTGPYFLATKIEAFLQRGDGDCQLSHDIEDIIAVVDGRSELLDEIESADPKVREYLQQKVAELVGDDDFCSSVPGHLPGDVGSQARAPAGKENNRGKRAGVKVSGDQERW